LIRTGSEGLRGTSNAKELIRYDRLENAVEVKRAVSSLNAPAAIICRTGVPNSAQALSTRAGSTSFFGMLTKPGGPLLSGQAEGGARAVESPA